MYTIMKKLCSLALSLIMMATLCMSGLAADAYTDENNSVEIQEFAYTIYDKDGNERESGIIPNPNSRYSWYGITLYNGEKAVLKQTNNRPFTIARGTRVEFTLQLSRACHMFTIFNRSDVYGNYKEIYRTYTSYGNPSTLIFTMDSPNGSYFYPSTTNYSSDPVTITEVSLVF